MDFKDHRQNMVEKYKITKTEEVYNLLKDKRNFKYMSESLLRRLISEMKVIRFTQKTLLLKQDTENRFIYIIIKGKITVYLEKKALYTLRRTGDVFGELSFATHSPSTASIVAEEGLGVMAISFNYLKKLNDIEFGLWLCHVLGEKLIRTSKLKAIRTTENIDELEGQTPAKNTPPKSDAPISDKVPAAAGGDIDIEDVMGDVETDSQDEEAESATGDIEIEDVMGNDEPDSDGDEETTSPEEETANAETKTTEGDIATEADPGKDEATVEAEADGVESAAGDDEEDDGEFMDLDLNP